MSETGLVAVMLMVGMVMLVMSFWKQIAIFMLFAVAPYSASEFITSFSLVPLHI